MLYTPKKLIRQPAVPEINRKSPANQAITTLIPFGTANYDLVTGARLTFGTSASTSGDGRGKWLKSAGTSACASIAIDLSPYTKLSVSFWLWCNSFANNDAMALEYGTTNSATSPGFVVDPNSSDGRFGVGVSSTSGTAKYNSWSCVRPSASAWHHYTINYNRTTGTSQSTNIYIDGVLQSVNAIGQVSDVADNFANSTLYIFSRNNTTLFCAGRLQNLVLRAGYSMTADEALFEYKNPWSIYKAPAPELIFASIASNFDLSGLAQSTTSATGQINSTLAISGASIGATVGTGAILSDISLNGSSASATIADGAVSIVMTLSGSSVASAIATAQADIVQSLSGDAINQSNATGNLSSAESGLSGDAVSSAIATGVITMSVAIAGNSISQALASAGFDISIPLSGLSQSGAVGAGDLASIADGELIGNAQGQSSASGQITIDTPLAGTASAYASGTGSIAAIIPIEGISASISTATGDLTINFAFDLSGDASTQSLANGNLYITMPLSGASISSAIANGLLGYHLSVKDLSDTIEWILYEAQTNWLLIETLSNKVRIVT
jgi:hypothetical protein